MSLSIIVEHDYVYFNIEPEGKPSQTAFTQIPQVINTEFYRKLRADIRRFVRMWYKLDNIILGSVSITNSSNHNTIYEILQYEFADRLAGTCTPRH